MRGTQNDIVMFELFELSGKEVIGIFTDKEKLHAMNHSRYADQRLRNKWTQHRCFH